MNSNSPHLSRLRVASFFFTGMLFSAGGVLHAQQTLSSVTPEVWFLFPRGTAATCAQGPFGSGTHSTGYAWDFVLREGTPILVPADGVVTLVIDHHKGRPLRPKDNSPAQIAEYQQLSMASSNRLVIDHGGGLTSNYWHHKAGTARVRVGDRVKAGARIADVGSSGTHVAHICFSMFILKAGTSASCDVRFRGQGGRLFDVKTGQRCVSGTPALAESSSAGR